MESTESKTQREILKEERVGVGEGGRRRKRGGKGGAKRNFNFLKGFRSWAISP